MTRVAAVALRLSSSESAEQQLKKCTSASGEQAAALRDRRQPLKRRAAVTVCFGCSLTVTMVKESSGRTLRISLAIFGYLVQMVSEFKNMLWLWRGEE